MRAARLKRGPNLRPTSGLPFRPGLRCAAGTDSPSPMVSVFDAYSIESIYVHRWLGQQRGIRENPIGTLRRAPLRRPRREYSRQMRGLRAVCGRIANIKDSLLEGVEFELSGDFLNGQ